MSVHIRFGKSANIAVSRGGGGILHPPHASARASLQATPFDPRIRASIRHALADEIDRLLNLIDVLDGDPDLEPPGDDEPSLGWTITMAHGTTDDAEQGEVTT